MKIINLAVLILLLLLLLIFNNVLAADKVEVTITDFPNAVIIGQEFAVNFRVKKTNSLFNSFYYKGRLGQTDLNQGETYNSLTDKWLTDTSAWSNYPLSILDENGTATITAKLRTKSTLASGPANLVLRINLDGTNYDSTLQIINLLLPLITPDPTPLISSSASSSTEESTLSSISSPTSIPTESPTPTPFPISNIFLSEIMVYPETTDCEWVEIYNGNNFPVSLNNWYLDDQENGGSSPKKFTLNLPALGLAVYDLSFSMFNNTQDQVRLLDNNKNVVDSFEYDKAEKNLTWARTDFTQDNFCLQTPSKNQFNSSSCLNATTTPLSPNSTFISSLPTLSPSKRQDAWLPSPTANNKKIARFTRIKPSLLPSITTNQILGINQSAVLPVKFHQRSRSLNKSLLFLSITLPILTIISVLLKIKKYAAQANLLLDTSATVDGVNLYRLQSNQNTGK
jgi:hypothetical protein